MNHSAINLNTPLTMKGITIKNRVAKGALSEGMATLGKGRVTPQLLNMYRAWGKGELAFCITGNVMVDVNAKNEPGNTVIEDERDLAKLQAWANIGKTYNMVQIVQLSHPGKQCPKGLNKETVAPSAIGFGAELAPLFGTPRALTEAEILNLIQRFGESARICKKAGFEGVQLHGAHGYLISQFLSPLHNQRSDQWGGSLENRMRFVLACYHEVRRQTGDDFIVGIKLNSADFQKGGFDEDEAVEVFKALDQVGIDFIEISGGTYEAGAMVGMIKKPSTQKREAYFIEFAEKIRSEVKTVLMVSGGFRTRQGMDAALQSGACDLIGVARPLIVDPNTPAQLLAGHNAKHALKPILSGIDRIDRAAGAEMLWYGAQMKVLGKGKQPNPDLSPLKVLVLYSLQNIGKVVQGRMRVRA